VSIEFQAWPKIARLNRDIVITEKIDGTNAAVVVYEWPVPQAPIVPEAIDELGRTSMTNLSGERVSPKVVHLDDRQFLVGAQSRKRLITPESDNFGFAAWVFENAVELVRLLGPGRHFGEWWGSGIQRGYGLANGDRRFSLFNTSRYGYLDTVEPDDTLANLGLDVVPVLYEGPFSEWFINDSLNRLDLTGSVAARGFDKPEGIVIYHTAAGMSFKVTLEGDEKPKGQVG
jgi:hypothetical protein